MERLIVNHHFLNVVMEKCVTVISFDVIQQVAKYRCAFASVTSRFDAWAEPTSQNNVDVLSEIVPKKRVSICSSLSQDSLITSVLK